MGNAAAKNRKVPQTFETSGPIAGSVSKNGAPVSTVPLRGNVAAVQPGSVSTPTAAVSTDSIEQSPLATPVEIEVQITPQLQPSKVTIDSFILLKVVGKGSFGKVFLAAKRDGASQLYAIKVLRKANLLRKNQIAHTQAERSILQAVNHPFIMTMHYAFQTSDKLYIVTDFCQGGELFFWLKKVKVFSQAHMRFYAAELVLALEHLHAMDVAYRDLKPENILLDSEGHVRLTDFGLAKMGVYSAGPSYHHQQQQQAGGRGDPAAANNDGLAHTFCGTPEYLAPEVLLSKGHGKAVDWWSLGTLLYEMIAGLPPFYSTNIEKMYQKILLAPLQWPPHFQPETISFLAGLLTRRPEERLGFRGAAEIKAHPFFRGVDWAALMDRRVPAPFIPPVGQGSHGGIPAVPSQQQQHARDTAGGTAAPDSRHDQDADADPVITGLVANFDQEFTREPPVDSVAESARLSSTAAAAAHFADFTYQPDTGLGSGDITGISHFDSMRLARLSFAAGGSSGRNLRLASGGDHDAGTPPSRTASMTTKPPGR